MYSQPCSIGDVDTDVERVVVNLDLTEIDFTRGSWNTPTGGDLSFIGFYFRPEVQTRVQRLLVLPPPSTPSGSSSAEHLALVAKLNAERDVPLMDRLGLRSREQLHYCTADIVTFPLAAGPGVYAKSDHIDAITTAIHGYGDEHCAR
jgi:hypothetical protein